MDQLTVFERSLLSQFEILVESSKSALDGSDRTSEALQALSLSVRVRLDQIEGKQREIEETQKRLLDVLNAQSKGTEDLVKQVNRLLDAQRR